MPRIPRMVRTDSGQKTIYHVISHTVLDGLPFKAAEKDEQVRLIRRFMLLYTTGPEFPEGQLEAYRDHRFQGICPFYLRTI